MSAQNKWHKNLEHLYEKRRGSVVKIFDRLRSGSLPGWVGESTSGPSHLETIAQSELAQNESPSTSTNGSGSTAEVKSNNLQKDNDNDYSDKLLMPVIPVRGRGDGGQTPEIYEERAMSSYSKANSPLFTERSFTIVPMKPMNEPNNETLLSRRQGNDNLGLVLSALYGKLLVVMGIAFPMSEVISTYIPPSFYDGFYLYLYFGSLTFMICIYGNILRQKATRSVRFTIQRINTMRSKLSAAQSGGGGESYESEGSCSEDSPLPSPCSDSCKSSRLPCRNYPPIELANRRNVEGSPGRVSPLESHHYSTPRTNFGSFYLRMGAVAFGIGSMIYSGLEFGQYFELEPDTKCHNFMIALTPAVRMIFTFGQMYFIFLNSKMAVSSVRLGAQFGLMHMIGTNLCVWLNVLVQETRHEILHFYNPDNHTFKVNYNRHVPSGYSTLPPISLNDSMNVLASNLSSEIHARHKRGLRGPHSIYECRRTDIMGSLVQNASPFLFPCTIEYSLICAAILYVMWKSIAKRRAALCRSRHGHRSHSESPTHFGAKRSPHHYSVDCARANKGLFLGIFFLVGTIISLILFFVLINRPGYQAMATLEVNITELVLYSASTIAVLIGMCQVRQLRFVNSKNLELDNILLIFAQTGSFIYNVFTMIGGHFTLRKNSVLVMLTALASLIQLLFQTLFILDASKRCASTPDQAKRKPGREVVTFLLVTNLAMWLINTLEKSRADSHPVQLKFYGVWAWTIITHISMPLAIFYRFHSTVCLCEIWKKAFKLKNNCR